MRHRTERWRARAFTMAEAAVCLVIVGVMWVAALRTAAFARTTEFRAAQRERGLLLAQELLAEILLQPYADPQSGTTVYGLETGEAGTGTRALFDDLDDYINWQESPPQAKDGTVMTELTGWKRQVRVQRLKLLTVGQESTTESGLRCCTVTVSHNGAVLAELSSMRSQSWTAEAR